jgi:cytochrome c-type biogenesis protein CcmF
MHRSLRDDLYTVVGSIDPESKKATFQFHVNPLVSWIWIGLLILMSGTVIALWPEFVLGEVGAWAYIRFGATAASGIIFSIWLAATPAMAYGQSFRPQRSPAVESPPGVAVQEASLEFGAPLGASGAGIAAGLLTTFAMRRPNRRRSDVE